MAVARVREKRDCVERERDRHVHRKRERERGLGDKCVSVCVQRPGRRACTSFIEEIRVRLYAAEA